MSADKIKDPKAAKRAQINTVVLAVGGLLLLVMVGLYVTDKKSGQDKLKDRTPAEAELVKNYALPGSQVRDEDKWAAEAGKQVATTQVDVEKLKKNQEDLLAEMERLKNNPLPAAQAPAPAVLTPPGMSPDRKALASNLVGTALPPPPPPPPMPAPGTQVTMGMDGQPVQAAPRAEIQEIDLTQPEVEKTAAAADKTKTIIRRVDSFVTAGSFAKVVLLSGFDAPTGGQAANMALPVVMRVKSFFNLPNYYRTNLKECFITANAYGDLPSERAYIRTSKMSCVMRNGNVLEVDVKGHVSGEDGSFGMRGKVVSKQGALLAKTFFSGLFAGVGNSIAAQNTIVSTSALGTTQTIDPSKTAQTGLATGASTALNKLAEFYLNQANSIFPIIEISAERVGEVYLMEGVDFGTALVAASHSPSGDQ